ncbi:MAG: hypothetical protein J5994_07225 [Ruminococcus sp.]|nr:hypothetical protein [Ruminococcus sp.]
MNNSFYPHGITPNNGDGTKIYLPTGQQYTLGEYLAKLNDETKDSDDSGTNMGNIIG